MNIVFQPNRYLYARRTFCILWKKTRNVNVGLSLWAHEMRACAEHFVTKGSTMSSHNCMTVCKMFHHHARLYSRSENKLIVGMTLQNWYFLHSILNWINAVFLLCLQNCFTYLYLTQHVPSYFLIVTRILRLFNDICWGDGTNRLGTTFVSLSINRFKNLSFKERYGYLEMLVIVKNEELSRFWWFAIQRRDVLCLW